MGRHLRDGRPVAPRVPSAQGRGRGAPAAPPRTRSATLGVAVLALALFVASCSSGGDSSGSKDANGLATPTGSGTTEGAHRVPADRGGGGRRRRTSRASATSTSATAPTPSCRATAGSGAPRSSRTATTQKVYEVGPVGEDPELRRHGQPPRERAPDAGLRGRRERRRRRAAAAAHARAAPRQRVHHRQHHPRPAGRHRERPRRPPRRRRRRRPAAVAVPAGERMAPAAPVEPAAPGLTVTVVPGGWTGHGAQYPPPPPSITVDDPNVRVGGDVVIRGRNCGANETLAVLFDGKQVGTITVGRAGQLRDRDQHPARDAARRRTRSPSGDPCASSASRSTCSGLAFTGAGNDTETTVLVGIVGARARRRARRGVAPPALERLQRAPVGSDMSQEACGRRDASRRRSSNGSSCCARCGCSPAAPTTSSGGSAR